MSYHYMDQAEKGARLYCTPPHITKALLKREFFPGAIWEPAAGRGHVVQVLHECGYRDVIASDLKDWGFRPCHTEDFLTARRCCDSLVTNPPFDLKMEFLVHAKQVAARKIALLLPVECEYTKGFVARHEPDHDFPWKAMYAFVQSIRWANLNDAWGKDHMAWFVFERGYAGDVIREKIIFRRNTIK